MTSDDISCTCEEISNEPSAAFLWRRFGRGAIFGTLRTICEGREPQGIPAGLPERQMLSTVRLDPLEAVETGHSERRLRPSFQRQGGSHPIYSKAQSVRCRHTIRPAYWGRRVAAGFTRLSKDGRIPDGERRRMLQPSDGRRVAASSGKDQTSGGSGPPRRAAGLASKPASRDLPGTPQPIGPAVCRDRHGAALVRPCGPSPLPPHRRKEHPPHHRDNQRRTDSNAGQEGEHHHRAGFRPGIGMLGRLKPCAPFSFVRPLT
jgi:hypothetical protein